MERECKDTDTVKGFDLQETLDIDLLIDLNSFENYIDDTVRGMLDSFFDGCELLK